ncbi:MAG: hypothetical protein KA522_02695, partial [Candidatus Saccharicenans sp.]|nr:hypothetical protein [Candidatus Saccharicenans sp.]
ALIVFFEQWLLLSEEEKTNVKQKIKDMEMANPGFLERFKRKWRAGHGDETELASYLGELGF